MKPSRWISLGLLIIGIALLILAVPITNWMGLSPKKEPVVEATSGEKSQEKLPRLRLKTKTIQIAPEEKPPETKPPEIGTGVALTNDEIEHTLDARQNQFQRCWTQRLKEKPGITGKVLLQFEISSRGKVSGAKIADSDIADESMLHCLVSVLERVTFREFRGAAISLTFPISFE